MVKGMIASCTCFDCCLASFFSLGGLTGSSVAAVPQLSLDWPTAGISKLLGVRLDGLSRGFVAQPAGEDSAVRWRETCWFRRVSELTSWPSLKDWAGPSLSLLPGVSMLIQLRWVKELTLGYFLSNHKKNIFRFITFLMFTKKDIQAFITHVTRNFVVYTWISHDFSNRAPLIHQLSLIT